jgi:NAD(P)-dependent dehydrogenase (short-subunit alcohol dehydrogenase family)
MKRSVIVTGGTGGLGGAVVSAFLASDDRVVVPWIVAAERDRMHPHFEAALGSEQLVLLEADIAEAEGAARVVKAAGDPSVLINGAGGFAMGPHHETDLATWDHLFRLNVRAAAAMTHAALPTFFARAGGAIVNVAANAALDPPPDMGAYVASKAALIAFTRSLAREVAGRGVRVNAIAPDVTQTPQVDYRNRIPEDMWVRWPLWVPVGGVGEPADNAVVVLFLASDLSRWVTGHEIPTDGGTLAAGGWFRTSPGGRWTNRPREA